MSKVSVKLPKQWRHWCASMHLRPHVRRGKTHWNWFYLKGRGYMWRVNSFAEFERGDTYGNFDRWARCNIDFSLLPQTKAEFQATVRHLVKEASK